MFPSTKSCSRRMQLHTLVSYSRILIDGLTPDPKIFPPLLQECASLASLSHGLTIHQHILVHGYAFDAYISSSLIRMYAKCGDLGRARQVFDQMPHRNVVPWTSIVGSYSQMGDIDSAFSLYNQMQHQGIRPNSVTVLGLLSGVLQLAHLQCVHACVIRSGFEFDIVVANSMVKMYARCGCVEVAQTLFDVMPRRDVITWNSLVSAYAQTGYMNESVDLLIRMRVGETKPDQQTFGSVVTAIANDGKLKLGRVVHAQIVTAGYEMDMLIETTLMGMYLKCGNVDDAFRVFDRLTDADVVSWTAMISGLVQNDRADEALSVFCGMLQSGAMPSTATIASALAASAQLGSFNCGASIHGYIIRRRMQIDIAAQNSLITMYAKCDRLEQCQAMFDRMVIHDVVSWNAMVTGYTKSGRLDKALWLFDEMRSAGQRADSITVVSLLQACASLGALHHGKWLHNFLIRNDLRPCISVDTALIDMYSKCGNIETAQRCFDGMPEQDLVAWSVIIAGYGCHGKGERALRMYSDLLSTGIKPNRITFLSVLAACSHSGLVDEGLRVFDSMIEEFGIEPELEHHACIVDLLGRAGRVEDAYKFVARMLPRPTVDVLGILLDACRMSGNAGLGEVVAGEILALKPTNAGNYVQLAHSYAAMSRWDVVGDALMEMRLLGLKKTPGWSSIELQGNITTFFVDHTWHPRYEEVMSILRILNREMRTEK